MVDVKINLGQWARVADKFKPGEVKRRDQAETLAEVVASLSQKQQNAAKGLLNDLVNADLATLESYRATYDPTLEEFKTAVYTHVADTGAAIQAAFLGGAANRPRHISAANYRRLRLMFDKWPKKRHALYIYLVIGHEARLKSELVKEPVIDFWEKVEELRKKVQIVADSQNKIFKSQKGRGSRNYANGLRSPDHA
jgi:hypothetical protein